MTPFTVEFASAAEGGPLFSCKEMFDVAGHPATAGHPRFTRTRDPAATSTAVRLLQQAGFRLRGKTRQSELALSALGLNRHEPGLLNARDPARVPGGSSSGCAVAVASGLTHVSLCTDTAGSARIPAACNEVSGLALADTQQLLQDAVQLSPTLDQLGLIFRDPGLLVHALATLGHRVHPRLPARLLVPRELIQDVCDADELDAFEADCDRLAGSGVGIAAGPSDDFLAFDALETERGSLALAEIAYSLRNFFSMVGATGDDAVPPRLAPYLDWATHERAGLRREVLRLRGAAASRPRDDAWLLPCLPVPVPLCDSGYAGVPLSAFTRYGNLMGMSSLSVPGSSGRSLLLQARDAGLLAGFALRFGAGA